MGKHSLEKKTNVLLIVIIIFVVIGIIGGGFLYFYNKNPRKKVEQAINTCFSAIKAVDVENITQYMNYEELISSLDNIIIENREETVSDLEKELFKEIEWNIENIEIEDAKAEAVIEMTNKNFKEVMTKWMQELAEIKLSGESISNEIALEKLGTVLKEQTDTKTEIKKITLNENGENWSIQVNESLRDLMYPGIDSVLAVLNKY